MLANSPVIFEELTHKYFLNGKELSGITSLLDRQGLKTNYDGIPVDVLEQAKQYGSLVHRQIEMYDAMGCKTPTTEELAKYQKLKDKHSLKVRANEYLVSDNDWVASSVDVVLADYSLADIKTTSKLDEEYVSWQLSIYAYLFELQNPGIRVPHLFAIWMPKSKKTAKLIELERKMTEWCKELIACDKRGEQYIEPTIAESETALTIPTSVVQTVIDIEQELKRLQTLKKELQSGLLAEMKKANVKSFKCDGLSLTYKAPTTRASIDAKMLEDKYPEIYRECLKESEVKESIMIKV